MSPVIDDPWSEACRFVEEKDRFLVISHLHPDGDAIGSTLAVGYVLKKLGKEVVMVNESPVPRKFLFLPGAGEIKSSEALLSEDVLFSSAIAVDCADEERMGTAKNLLEPSATLLNIDHHSTNNRFGTVNLVLPDAAATAEILCQWSDELGVKWDRDLATCLYTGLLTDTGGFRYSNTTPLVMELASRLLRCGVDNHGIADRALETLSRGQVELIRQALATLSFSNDGLISWMWLTQDDYRMTGAGEEDLDGIVNYARNVEGVDVGILFRETQTGEIKVSLRSREQVDVGALAQLFGGGGHARAAGCTLKGRREEVEEILLERVSDALQRS
ncbi:bifunctional oligoribonuclease/PAP phosphatase NrnA [Kroppenstedtia pulmonis]|uniref:Bifunctional oligoribonuclease/PAP phosphatase NrnA n=1 Tax=Kroppenstedtia pulmonis TaxID=1380685 RepID=A0A7D4CN42_9BACL|nr:bifunctional oligoribonuclease/PAP phosphatase NrnA [Kroppenstedtia pulmonis]QKG84558.1 bifunctional oligoribonuclease/PAP phosphatase NrnA [Kroppenstedtia pulmonis]